MHNLPECPNCACALLCEVAKIFQRKLLLQRKLFTGFLLRRIQPWYEQWCSHFYVRSTGSAGLNIRTSPESGRKNFSTSLRTLFYGLRYDFGFLPPAGSLLSWHKREEKVKSRRCFSPHQKKPSKQFWLGLRFRHAIFFDPPFSTHPAIIGSTSWCRVERTLAAWTGHRTRSRFLTW